MRTLSKLFNRLPLGSRFFVILVISGLAISGSFFAQFVLGKTPCFLCLVQRTSYCLLLATAGIGFFLPFKFLANISCRVILIFLCLVSVYHNLVYFKFLKDRCISKTEVIDIESYKMHLTQNRNDRVSCSENIWKVGSVPISIINIFISFFLLYFLIVSSKINKNSY